MSSSRNPSDSQNREQPGAGSAEGLGAISKIKLGASDRLFVLTGAGISAESGIPTFRDADGLWHGYRIEEVACPEAWHRDPGLVWNFYSMRRAGSAPCEPNAAHRSLVEVEKRLGDRFFLCTQNVDDLHERAGSERLVHMHGELFKSRCEHCRAEAFDDRNLYETATKIPRCPHCGKKIRPNIVWFGEMPFGMDQILHELDVCTVLLVVGTSGLVYPAAGFVHMVNSRYTAGGSTVRTYYVGPEEPANAEAFTNVLLGKAAEVLPTAFEFVEQ